MKKKDGKYQWTFEHSKGGVSNINNHTTFSNDKAVLEAEMQKAIESENYELAAIVRDKIRQLSHK